MKISTILVPTCLGVRRHGAEYGAEVIFGELSKRVNIQTNTVIEVNNIDTNLNVIDINKKVVSQVNNSIATEVRKQLISGHFPIIVGGDHSLAIGSVAGICQVSGWKKTLVIWLDAHGDLNTYKTTPSNNTHGMSAASLLGLGDEKLKNVDGSINELPKENLLLIGARDLDDGEVKLIKDKGIKTFYSSDFSEQEIYDDIKYAVNKKINEESIEHIHLSFDIDCIDPKLIDSVSTPVPNGLTLEEVYQVISMIADTKLLKSMDIVEFNPEAGNPSASIQSFNKLLDLFKGDV